MGEKEKGISSLEMAAALDCGMWRADPPIIAIQRKLALKYDLMIIDYHGLLTEMVGSNILFLDDLFPQHIFNEKMANTLIIPIKKYLKL